MSLHHPTQVRTRQLQDMVGEVTQAMVKLINPLAVRLDLVDG